MAIIRIKNLTKNFGKTEVLKNISFEVNPGEIVGFLGPNGAGKTTLMRILTTYLTPTQGEVFIDGKNVIEHALLIRAKIGYLPEQIPLYPSMRVYDYLKFAAQLKDIPQKSIRLRIEQVLEECDLKNVAQKMIAHLSKGYKQRVGIAQAIIHDPQILILDEPTSGLDPIQVQSVRRLIKNLEHKRTVILSTHILSEIEHLAHRVIIIQSGEIKKDALLEDLLKEDVTGKSKTLEEVFLNTVGNKLESHA